MGNFGHPEELLAQIKHKLTDQEQSAADVALACGLTKRRVAAELAWMAKHGDVQVRYQYRAKLSQPVALYRLKGERSSQEA